MNERQEKIMGIALNRKNPYEFINLPGEMSLKNQCDRESMTEKDLSEAEGVLNELEAAGIRIIPCTSEDYPASLKSLPEYPVILYVKSLTPAKELFKTSNIMVSIVGTRDISPYGKDITVRLVNQLADECPGYTMISGLAIGVDAAAHRAALNRGIRTIAVIPTGIDVVYPLRHREMAEEIIDKDGALISMYPPETDPLAINFLIRNRVIAGLADTVFVTESKTRGGAMVTARLAYDFGRDVLAVPGRVDDIRSAGCNQLIKEGVAEMWIPQKHCYELP